MRFTSARLFIVLAFVPALACEIQGGYQPPQVAVQAQVDTPPQPQVTAQVDVNAQQPDPNAQQAQADPNAQQATGDQVTDADPSAISDFKDALQPYGTWQDDPQYGTIWSPNPSVVGGDFQPYSTAGHWVYDNNDYTWVSDYDWGWAPFHYGRWVSLPNRGWSWIPGKEYAGAWVTWRNGDDGFGFVGWAPTAPTYYWRGGVAVNLATPWFQPRYTYAGTGDLFAPSIRERIIRDPGRITLIEGRTRPFTPSERVVINGGVRVQVRGPAPAHLGLNASTLPRVPANHPGILRAQQFSHASLTRTNNVTMNNNSHAQVNPNRPVEQVHQTQQQQHATDPRGNQQVQQQQVQQHPVEQHVQQQQVQQQQHQVVQPAPTNLRRPTPPPSSTTHSRR